MNGHKLYMEKGNYYVERREIEEREVRKRRFLYPNTWATLHSTPKCCTVGRFGHDILAAQFTGQDIPMEMEKASAATPALHIRLRLSRSIP